MSVIACAVVAECTAVWNCPTRARIWDVSAQCFHPFILVPERESGSQKRFRSAVHALTAAVNCQGCEHCHYTTVCHNNDISPVGLPNEKDKLVTGAVPGRISNDLPARPQEPPVVRNELDCPLPGTGAGNRNGGFPGVCRVRLLGTRTSYEVSWRAIFDLAAEIRARRDLQRKLLG